MVIQVGRAKGIRPIGPANLILRPPIRSSGLVVIVRHSVLGRSTKEGHRNTRFARNWNQRLRRPRLSRNSLGTVSGQNRCYWERASFQPRTGLNDTPASGWCRRPRQSTAGWANSCLRVKSPHVCRRKNDAQPPIPPDGSAYEPARSGRNDDLLRRPRELPAAVSANHLFHQRMNHAR